MTAILAIDPGSEVSAWLVLKDGRPFFVGGPADNWPRRCFGIVPNDELARSLEVGGLPNGILGPADVVVIEQIEPRYGLQAGWEVLDTARWVGRFEQAAQPTRVVRLRRSEILRHLGVVTSAGKGERRVSADAGIRAALIDRFGVGWGKAAAIGTRSNPGPLHGITKDVWAALAVAVTYADQGGS